MFEKATDRARKVMHIANVEAIKFDNEYVSVEHILLGLLKEGSGVAANILKNAGICSEHVLGILGTNFDKREGIDLNAKLPLTIRSKKVLEYAEDEARILNHNYIGTEHLLLGLLREEEGPVYSFFCTLGIAPSDLRDQTLNILGFDTDYVLKFEKEASNKLLREYKLDKIKEIVKINTDPNYALALIKELMEEK